MSNNKDFVGLLQDLCEMYENYVSKNSNSRLKVLIEDNSISIDLYADESIDAFKLSFNKRENDIYLYLSIIIMKTLFGNSVMYNKDNLFYNDDKPYLEVVVNDEDMLNKIFNVIIMGKKMDIYRYMDDVNKKTYVKKMEERISLSRKLLRVDGK